MVQYECGGTRANTSLGWFEQLYGEAYGASLAFARKLVGAADADDIVQETFLRLARYRPAMGEHVGIQFVMTVTRNVALTYLAKRTKDRLKNHERHAARRCADHEGASAVTTNGWAREQLEALPESHREAFVLVEVMGLSESQASLVMDLSRPVVGAKKRCAAEALRIRALRLDGPAGSTAGTQRLAFPRLSHRCA